MPGVVEGGLHLHQIPVLVLRVFFSHVAPAVLRVRAIPPVHEHAAARTPRGAPRADSGTGAPAMRKTAAGLHVAPRASHAGLAAGDQLRTTRPTAE